MEDRFPGFAGLKAFFAVGHSSGVADAAQRLGISRSAVSHQLKKLEGELGVRLYERDGRTLRLTHEGAEFFSRIEQPMIALREAFEEIRSTSDRLRVTMTLTPTFATDWFLPRMKKLSAALPDLELNLVSTTRVIDLQNEAVDIAIRRGHGTWEGLQSVLVLEEQVVPVVSPALLAESGAQNLTDLIAHAGILINENLPREWDEWFLQHGLEPETEPRKFALTSYEMAIAACRDGLGVALGRRPFADPVLTSGEVVQPFSEGPRDRLGYFIVWPRKRQMNAMTRKVRDWLVAEASMN